MVLLWLLLLATGAGAIVAVGGDSGAGGGDGIPLGSVSPDDASAFGRWGASSDSNASP